jgi:hypothetical protein
LWIATARWIRTVLQYVRLDRLPGRIRVQRDLVAAHRDQEPRSPAKVPDLTNRRGGRVRQPAPEELKKLTLPSNPEARRQVAIRAEPARRETCS